MKSIAKNFGKLNQLVGEKFNSAQKHELTDDFKQLETQTEARKNGVENMLESTQQYIKTLEKKKEGTDKQKYLAIEGLGVAMVSYGSDLHEDSRYGQALVKFGEVEQRIGEYQKIFVTKTHDTMQANLEAYMVEIKNYKHLRAKVESRRLDFDAKMNRIQKSKKENPSLDEEMRAAQQKYEEILQETEQFMLDLLQREDGQLEGLLSFLDAQHDYHAMATSLLLELKGTISDSSIRGKRLERQEEAASKQPAAANPFFDAATPERQMKEVSLTSSGEVLDGAALSSTNTLSVLKLSSTRQSSELSTGSEAPPNQQVQKVKKLVRANYSFTAENKEELSINKGDVISVIDEPDKGWWVGEIRGTRGLFPANYCEAVPESASFSQNNVSQQQQQRPVTPVSAPVGPSGIPKSNSVPKFSYLEKNDFATAPPLTSIAPKPSMAPPASSVAPKPTFIPRRESANNLSRSGSDNDLLGKTAPTPPMRRK